MVVRFSSTLLSKTADFVASLCDVIPINLPASHINALRIMNTILFNTFLPSNSSSVPASPMTGSGTSSATWDNPNIYMSSEKYSFRTRINWMEKKYTITASNDTVVFEYIKKHLLLVEIYASAYMGINQWKRALIELNASQYLLQKSMSEHNSERHDAFEGQKRDIIAQIHGIEAQIAGIHRKLDTINKNMEQKQLVLESVQDCLQHAENDLAVVNAALSTFVADSCVAVATLLRVGK